jgi:choline monooxygenase
VATDVCGWGLLLVVDRDGALRGFHNVCRHRAGPLVDDDAGNAALLVCRYHGWAYDLEGALRTARDFGAAQDFDPAEFGLHPVRVERWRGLVFVNVDLAAAPLLEVLGGFAAECDGFPMEDFEFTSEVNHELAANWKTYADNYMEGYHIPLVHPANREIDARLYRVDVHDRYAVHSAPARDGSPTSGRWLWRFPNLALNLYPEGMNVECFVPVGPTRTRVVYHYFFRGGREDKESIDMSMLLLDEDARICEAVQRNLESGAYESGRLSPRHEQGVGRLQELVREALRGEPG